LKPYLDRAAFYLICGSLISILFSIAASQILLGLALAALLLSSERLRLPQELHLQLFALQSERMNGPLVLASAPSAEGGRQPGETDQDIGPFDRHR